MAKALARPPARSTRPRAASSMAEPEIRPTSTALDFYFPCSHFVKSAIRVHVRPRPSVRARSVSPPPFPISSRLSDAVCDFPLCSLALRMF